jgi:hypothetical protein
MKYIQIRNLPPPPQKKAAKFSFCGEKVGNLLNIGRKSKKCRLESGMEPSVEFSV